MSNSMNNTGQLNLQTEIAILQKKILAFRPCMAKLVIPTIMNNDNMIASTGEIDNYIEVPMPVHLAMSYGSKVIPKDTKLIVQTVAGNYNNIKIIGYYDEPKAFDFISLMRKYVVDGDDPLPSDYGTFDYDEI